MLEEAPRETVFEVGLQGEWTCRRHAELAQREHTSPTDTPILKIERHAESGDQQPKQRSVVAG